MPLASAVPLKCFLCLLPFVQVDVYGTQAALCLVRQHIEHGFWFDRVKLQQKVVQHCQYVAALNPAAGSFVIDPRLQVRDVASITVIT